MATTYPGTIQTFTNPAGTNTLDSPDHASQHTTENDTVLAIQNTLGTTAGSALFTAYGAADKPAKKNSETLGSVTINGGTINSVTLGTPIANNINSSGTTAFTTFGAGILVGEVTLSDSAGGTITPNAAAGNMFTLVYGTTAGNRTIALPANISGPAWVGLRVKQNAASTGTVLWATNYKFSGGTANAYALGTTASAWNYFAFRYNSAGTTMDEQGQIVNII